MCLGERPETARVAAEPGATGKQVTPWEVPARGPGVSREDLTFPGAEACSALHPVG